MQGDFLICNTIGFLGVKQYKLHRDGDFSMSKKSGKWENGKQVTSKSKFGEVWGTPHGQKLSVIKDLAEWFPSTRGIRWLYA